MRLVDHDPLELRRLDRLRGSCVGEPLGRQVQELEPAVGRVVERAVVVLRVAQPVDCRHLARRDPLERADLVLHQCDERADDEGQTVGSQGGQLVTERLPGSRGHDTEHIAAGERGLDGLPLSRTESAVAEAAEQLEGVPVEFAHAGTVESPATTDEASP